MLKVVLRLCAGALLASASHQAIAQSADWTVSETRGPVTIVSAQGREAATRGADLGPGDTIVTGPGGRAVLVHKKDFVTVAANSRVRIPSGNAQTGITRFFQEIGNAIFSVEKRNTPHFSVDTPFLAAVVKGTVFSVSVNADSTALQVTEGVVEVATTDGGARDLVRPGSIAMIAAGDRYRLTISGDRAATIDSPARVTAAEPAAASPASASPADTSSGSSGNATTATEQTAAAGETVSVRIEEAVVSKPVDLAKATNGILTGMSPVAVAAEVGLSKAVAETPVREPALAGSSPPASEKPAGKPDEAKADDKPDAGKPDDSGKDKDKPDAGKPDDSGKDKDKPDAGKPDDSGKDKDKPDAGKPDDSGKDKDKPDAGKPDDSGKDKGKPDAGKPDDSGKDKGKPDAGKPDDSGKDKGKPDAGKPDDVDKDKGKPGAGKPDDAGKGTEKPDAGKPDDAGKGTDKPDAGKPDDSGKGTEKPDAGKPDDSGKGTDKPDAGKPDDAGKGTDKPDAGKPDDGGKDTDKPDADKPDKVGGRDGGGLPGKGQG